MHPIGMAIVGMGKIARDQHLPSLRADDRFRLVATVDPHAGLPGVPHFADIDALLASDLTVEAVAICTPPQARGPIARAALSAGLHVLLEKPPAATLAEFADLKARAKVAGVTLFAAWHSRFAPMVSQAGDWLADRTVVAGQVTWREDVRRWHPGQAWLWAPGGLGVFDPGINAFSILTALLPAPITVARARLAIPGNAHTPIAATLVLRSGGAEITVDLDFVERLRQSWTITLDTACGHRLVLSDGGGRLALDGGEPAGAPEREYAGVYARFATLIMDGASDVDAAPLRLVADALLVAGTDRVAPFVE